ncbi:hypothetical protein ABZX40_28970 [Streptomyces sp. NPDC004610]|uniref:hypothetical protein n=1 Tax=unclassified Streptomyces TaxID=2593676 RepID=UPI0033A56FD6
MSEDRGGRAAIDRRAADIESVLLAHRAERLAGYIRPRSVDSIAEMPRDPDGRLCERRLRAPYRQGRARPL